MDYIGYRIIQSGFYEPDLYNLLASSIKTTDIYVDIGSKAAPHGDVLHRADPAASRALSDSRTL
jgi:hypothetical protein